MIWWNEWLLKWRIFGWLFDLDYHLIKQLFQHLFWGTICGSWFCVWVRVWRGEVIDGVVLPFCGVFSLVKFLLESAVMWFVLECIWLIPSFIAWNEAMEPSRGSREIKKMRVDSIERMSAFCWSVEWFASKMESSIVGGVSLLYSSCCIQWLRDGVRIVAAVSILQCLQYDVHFLFDKMIFMWFVEIEVIWVFDEEIWGLVLIKECFMTLADDWSHLIHSLCRTLIREITRSYQHLLSQLLISQLHGMPEAGFSTRDFWWWYRLEWVISLGNAQS